MSMPHYHLDEDGFPEIDEKCMDCEYSYVEDIWFEWMCKKNKCPYEEEENQ